MVREIKIEKNVPIICRTKKRNVKNAEKVKSLTEALKKMKMGDSFVIHCENEKNYAYRIAIKLGIKIIIRGVGKQTTKYGHAQHDRYRYSKYRIWHLGKRNQV